MPEQPPVTRFAPSPTGALHVGGARTALFNWAFARRHGGRFLLRIEDTDAARSTAEAAQGILRGLAWLGLDWDEGPDPQAANWDEGANQLGDKGPYFQSQRRATYDRYLQQLLDAGRAYEAEGAVRFAMPDEPITVEDQVLGEVTVQPDQPQMQDFVIYKSSEAGGGPTYHFAVVVDDAEMGVNTVIRGQEHLNNTIKHVALQRALGLDEPAYAHIPLIFNADGSKMSKRDKAKAARQGFKQQAERDNQGYEALADWICQHDRKLQEMGAAYTAHANHPTVPSVQEVVNFVESETDRMDVARIIARQLFIQLPEIDVDDFRRSGYLPEVLCNYLALLGWNPGGDVERFGADPLGFLAEQFSLDRVQKANARFDRDKHYAFNQAFLSTLPFEQFEQRLKQHLRQYHPEFEPLIADPAGFRLFAEAYQPRTHVLSEPAEIGWFFVRPPHSDEFEEKAVKKNLAKNEGEGFAVLGELRDRFTQLDPWSGEAAHELLQDYARAKEMKMGKVAQPVRVAVSGKAATPEIDRTLAILGKDATIQRIDTCLEQIAPAHLGQPQSWPHQTR